MFIFLCFSILNLDEKLCTCISTSISIMRKVIFLCEMSDAYKTLASPITRSLFRESHQPFV